MGAGFTAAWGENIGKNTADNIRNKQALPQGGPSALTAPVDKYIGDKVANMLDNPNVQERLDLLLERRLDALLEKLSLGFKGQMTETNKTKTETNKNMDGPKRKDWGKMRRSTHTYKAQVAKERQEAKLREEKEDPVS